MLNAHHLCDPSVLERSIFNQRTVRSQIAKWGGSQSPEVEQFPWKQQVVASVEVASSSSTVEHVPERSFYGSTATSIKKATPMKARQIH